MIRLLAYIFLLTFFGASAATAASSDWQQDSAVAVRLISGVDGVGQEKTVPLGLEVKLASDWHTYWRSPGDAGLPPQINWGTSTSDSGNLAGATLLFPAPKRYTAYGLETIGYRDHVVFPIDATLKAPGHALAIDGTVDLLLCSDVCVPKHFPLKLTVPEGNAGASVEAPLIKEFRDKIPGDSAKSGISVSNASYANMALIVDIKADHDLSEPDIFLENDKKVFFAPPIFALNPDKRSGSFNIRLVDTPPEGVDMAHLPLTLTVIDGDHALEQTVTAQALPPPPPPAPVAPPPVLEAPAIAMPSIGAIILFAIIGGFILNLMPCVLPVLSLKIISVASHGGGDPRTVRHSFLMTAAGIMFSFLVLAVITVSFKELGHTLGWGVQFQQPLFLVFLILLLTFFAANMWDLFEINAPRFIGDRMDPVYHPKLAGDFATGAFATLLATPCTAPFLGTAVGFALASGPRDIFIVFTSLGFGMILPYLGIAVWPSLATSLPKPGPWMVFLRRLLGWALALTAIWLIWVLAAQVSQRVAAHIGLCMAFIVGFLGVKKGGFMSRVAKIAVPLLVALAFGLVLISGKAPPESANAPGPWEPFSEAAIARNVAQGKTVFVDITADWCLTCKANKRFVLSRDEVTQRLFHSRDIVAMQADWTNPNPVIAAFLEKYERFGVPFNAVFSPIMPQGEILPELLTPRIVLDALDRTEKISRP